MLHGIAIGLCLAGLVLMMWKTRRRRWDFLFFTACAGFNAAVLIMLLRNYLA